MPHLRSLRGPEDLRALPADQLPALAAEIRDALVTSVAKTGGHLGPNLGCVELTIALHRVFDSPHDRLLWDSGRVEGDDSLHVEYDRPPLQFSTRDYWRVAVWDADG